MTGWLDAAGRFEGLHGGVAPGFERVARVFARQLAAGDHIGGGFAVFRRGEPVVDLWGGLADVATKRPWERDTRVVVFSVTKGFAAMALHLLADRGRLDWDAPVAHYWPAFAQNGKASMTVGTLLGHRGGLASLDVQLSLADCCDPARADFVRHALETQRPAWTPGADQGYHATTYGLYASELFRRVAGEELGPFLARELFAPLGSDVFLGTPPSEDARMATLYPPAAAERVGNMLLSAATARDSAEAGVFRAFLTRGSTVRGAFLNPALPREGVVAYNQPPVTRAELAWAGATGTARGVARAYLPFAGGGTHDGRRYLQESTLRPAYARLGWSERDRVLCKPLGWSNGFLKEERHVFSPNPESFGHAGMGGTLGWADPIEGLAIGYVTNRMDWRIRSKRALELTRALYDCDALASPRIG